jgi:catechol 2,3-dioxygenase-like lactoylglutathione lyase family enzyme
MRVIGLHHVSINVCNVGEAVAFYRDVLGFGVRSDRPDFSFDGAWLDVGPQQVHLLDKPVPDSLGQHFAVGVTDLDAAVAELRARGVEVSDPAPVGATRQAFLRDPSGNSVELQEIAAIAP